MESTTKKVILPTKGICNTTPDPICDDNELLDCVGLTFHDDALRPIQKTVKLHNVALDGELLFVHALNDGVTKNYIIYNQDLNIYDSDGENIQTIGNIEYYIYSIKSVGNTLIANTSEGLHYFLWKNEGYDDLGTTIPFPEIEFSLTSVTEPIERRGEKLSGDYGETIIDKILGNTQESTLLNDSTVTDMYLGLYAEAKKRVYRKRGFCNPFLLRYAVELYDGTYTLHSNPILMYPAVSRNHYFSNASGYLKIFLRYCNLQYRFNQQDLDYSAWKDIVKNIVVFITDPTDIYDTAGDCFPSAMSSEIYWDGIVFDNGSYMYKFDVKGAPETKEHQALQHTTKKELIDEISSSSVFYKIMSLGIDNLPQQWESTTDKIKKYTLENINTQEILSLDYHSHCSVIPNKKSIETFNRRLNAFNVKRNFFDGFSQFMLLNAARAEQAGGYTTFTGLGSNLTFYVYIKTDFGNIIVKRSGMSKTIFGKGYWFYYPDTRAFKVVVCNQNGYIGEYALKEHSGLNGAFLMNDVPTEGDILEDANKTGTIPTPTPLLSRIETLPNYLLQSEVDNPFTFFASGYVRVGQGTIIGMAGLTTALSQDAYKVSTTLAFTTQGIWALTINDEGQYKAVAPPFSREVCTNPDSITMIDNGVFFASEKGLMLITDDSIKCVSSHLAGKVPDSAVYDEVFDGGYKDFIAFLKGCKIAYDYRDSQLILTNNTVVNGSAVYSYHWVYNIKTGSFTRFYDGNTYKAIVPDYPDTIMQDTTGRLYSVLNEPNVNGDTRTYNGYVITRPMKFNEAMKLKSIREIKHITDFHKPTDPQGNDRASIGLTIYASNDCQNWNAVNSLAGRGFKYFIFRYDFEDLLATDAFCGSIIGYDTRQTNKLR